MKKIVLFASGAGTNAENIILHFKNGSSVNVAGVFSNNPNAVVLQRAAKHQVPTVTFSKEQLNDGTVLKRLSEFNPDLIVLAGFLWQFPIDIISAYPQQIINIHPALLPKYGGKGMYGMHVHRAVIANGETESGISIHYVDAHYDQGDMIFQEKIVVAPNDNPETVAEKVHALEHQYFPKIIAQLLADAR